MNAKPDPTPAEALAMPVAEALELVREFAPLGASEHGTFQDRRNVNAALATLARAVEGAERKDTRKLADIPQSMYDLARRCLHIAFVWNDHNFAESPVEMAKKEAKKYGITDIHTANSYLDAPDEWPAIDTARGVGRGSDA